MQFDHPLDGFACVPSQIVKEDQRNKFFPTVVTLYGHGCYFY